MALRGRIALLAAALVLPAQPLQAQSPAPYLFGYGAQRPYSGYGARSVDEAEPLQQGGTVRTLCVRLCDGYYFPMSHAVPRSTLARDADACSARCGADARLFYHPTHDGDVESMVDLSGMAYASLPNAFRYRKSLVEGCSCRPQPWSDVERQRHRGYDGGETAATTAAPSTGAPDDRAAVVRPQPVARQMDPPPPRGPGRSQAAPRPQVVWPGARN